MGNAEADPPELRGRLPSSASVQDERSRRRLRRGNDDGTFTQVKDATREVRCGGAVSTPTWHTVTGSQRMTEGSVVPLAAPEEAKPA